MATIGVYVRVTVGREGTVREALAALAGARPFDLEEPGKVGLVLEADDLDAAHALLEGPVRSVPGVLAAWPVYAHFGEE